MYGPGVRRLLPNAVTILRLLLLPFFGWAVVASRPGAATALLAVIAASDFVDGYLARRWHAETRFGAVLDPVADKLTQITGLILLAFAQPPVARIPPLFVGLVLARDLWLLYGALRIRVRRGNVSIRPRWEGKSSTAVVFALLLAASAGLPQGLVTGLAVVAAPLVAASAIRYTLDGRRQLRGS